MHCYNTPIGLTAVTNNLKHYVVSNSLSLFKIKVFNIAQVSLETDVSKI